MRSFRKPFQLGGSFIYGRDDDINGITELLSSENKTDINSAVVSIVSDKGTGRTTMLHLLYNELCSDFDITKYICMPENFEEKGIMRLIIESLTGSHCDITDLTVLKETVKEELIDQRLLLLLDNFENKSQKYWDLLLALLKFCKEKSAVVVTATREAVAKVKGPIHFYYLNNLSEEWCWMIFKHGVFAGQNPDSDRELADIGKCLVAKCNNSALCIKVLSGVLRYSIGADIWKAVLDDNFWEMDEVNGGILPALRVCYEYLPFHLKQCFKYCSLFPKEYIFSKKHLVRMWLSQGFIEPGEGREPEEIALEYFDQLLSRSLLQASHIPDMKEDRFVMSGCIHDLAQQLSKNEYFQFEGCVERAPENACHLALIPHEFQSVSLSHLITRPQNLQTILVVGRSAFQHQSVSFILKLTELEDLFVQFCRLITLDLSNADVEELPKSLGSLRNLRYLRLSSTNIKRLPLEISNLIHLQTLEARDCHYLGELPRTIEALTSLHYLDVTKETGYVVMSHGIGKLTNLRNLATFNVGKDSLLHCGIEELKDMKYLKGCLEISGLINVRSGIDAKKADLRSKDHIETLCLQWSDGMSYLEGEEGTEIAEEVLESLHPTENLHGIIIRNYPGKSIPMWIEYAAFSKLVSIIFDNCNNCETLPALGGLPLLRFLSIRKMNGVQRMCLSGPEHIPENIIRYPSLKQLAIWEMYELVEWSEIGNGHFPVLHSLCISRCPFLMNVPKFPALIELSIYSSAQFLKAMDLPSLKSLRIEGLQKTRSFFLPEKLVGLNKLEIRQCHELLSIEDLSLLNSLETIFIYSCAQFNSSGIIDEKLFDHEDRGNTSIWLRKTKITSSDMLDFGTTTALSDEQQELPILLKERKDREYLSTLSGLLAEEHNKIKECQPQMSELELELTCQQAPSPSLSMSGVAVSDPRQENSCKEDTLIIISKDAGGIDNCSSDRSILPLAPPPCISFPKYNNQRDGSVWDLVLSFGPDRGKDEEHNVFYGDNKTTRIDQIDIDEEDKHLDEVIDGFRSGETSPLSTSNDDEMSSINTEAMFGVSPARFKKQIRSWMRGYLLGHGSFGKVYEGISDEGMFLAVKEVSLLGQGSNAQQCITQLEEEIAYLSQFEHENIVQYYGTDKEEAKLYIFLELLTKGSLLSLYKRYHLRDSQVSAYTRQILRGLVYLHERNVIHRDIKCANILVHADGSVKLADFGLAKEITNINNLKSWKGSAYWMAPEVVNPKSTYGPAADIWSLGCTVLEMLTRQVPYPHLEWTQALFQIGQGIPPPIPRRLSRYARSFIRECVRVDPYDRPFAFELLDHPFVKGCIQSPFAFEFSSPFH